MTATASSKFNAQRAATRAGLDLDTLDFIKDAEGRWSWTTRLQPPADAAVGASCGALTVDASRVVNGVLQPAPVIERLPVLPPDGGAAWRALYEGPALEAEPVEDDEPAPVAPVALVSPPRRGKSAALVAKASSPEGITNAEIKALTGWTKFGGFFDAVKRAGLVLRRQREATDTRWFASAPAEAVEAA